MFSIVCCYYTKKAALLQPPSAVSALPFYIPFFAGLRQPVCAFKKHSPAAGIEGKTLRGAGDIALSDMRNEEKHANRTSKYMDSGVIIAQYVVVVNIFVKTSAGRIVFSQNSSCKQRNAVL
jgi:hypothetical protein